MSKRERESILVERAKPCFCDSRSVPIHLHQFFEIMEYFRKGNPFMAFFLLGRYEPMAKLILEEESYKKKEQKDGQEH